MRYRWVLLACCLLFSQPVSAVNYIVTGDMGSDIDYELKQNITEAAGLTKLELRFVVPQSYTSPTYVQEVSDVRLDLKPKPKEQTEETDKRGNKIIRAVWKKPPGATEATLSFRATTRTTLALLNTKAPFPLEKIPPRMTDYVSPTEQIQSDHPELEKLAQKLGSGAKSQFDAVQQVLTWVVDHVKYVSPPKQYDALYSYNSGKGNCQNFSHLAAALMRANGIPVRIVNGITLNRPFHIQRKGGNLTFKMAQGRHSWIEVWFPDLDWVPFDPQQMELFVPNRYIRLEIGVDNKEAINDGLLRWSRPKSVNVRPRMQENIAADFVTDNVSLSGARQDYGPQNLLLCPRVETEFAAVKTAVKPKPKPITIEQLETMDFPVPFLFGNLSFPIDVDFAFPREGGTDAGTSGQQTRNFLVESAEYVTTKATQYAQVVVLEKPVRLEKIGLALHNFGGDGMLWLELRGDREDMPGEVLAASDLVELKTISTRPGYRWEDFDFSRDTPLLSPGHYWIVLGFSGSPIVNWFYTYGKSVGPAEGTRYKGVFDEMWSGALSYEFNYRVIGKTTK